MTESEEMRGMEVKEGEGDDEEKERDGEEKTILYGDST